MIGSKVTSKGQTTIPKEVREYLGLRAGDTILFVRKDAEVVLQPVKATLLDFRGSVRAPRRAEDLGRVREKVKRRVAGRAARG